MDDVRIRGAELDEARVAALSDRIRADPQRNDLEVSWVWWSYGSAVLETALTSWTLDRRVPDLTRGNTVVTLERDGFTDARMVTPSFAALGHPARDGDHRCGSEDELFGFLVARVIDEHLDPVQRWIASALPPVSLRVLWGNLVQTAAAIMAEASLAPGADRDRVWRDTVRLLVDGPPQLRRKATLFTLLDGPRTRITLKRTTCCLAFKTGDGSTCGACPLRTDGEVVLAALGDTA